MRNMSFSMTTQQIKDGTKTVTRRFGWDFLKPGDELMACVKTMGFKPGEKVVKLRPIRVVDVKREPLKAIFDYPNDCTLEGFPHFTPDDFIKMMRSKFRCDPDAPVTRIEFEYI